jgi:hypothetical protein
MIMVSMEISFFHTRQQVICRISMHIVTLLAFINSDSDCAFPRIELVKKIRYPQTSCMSIWSLNRLHLKDLDQYIVSNNEENGLCYAKSQYQMLLLLYVPSRSSNVCLVFYLLPSLLINYAQLLPFTTIAD